VQLREKRGLDIGDKALAIRELCGTRAQLIIDDRVEVARDVDAFGVHLGRNDMPVHEARRGLGPIACIGGTANSLEEARALLDAPLDYLGVGPVYGTTSKANPAPVLGVDTLRAIAAESPVPVIAIGGIRPENVAGVLAAGAHGVAVLSGIVCAGDPALATAEYRAAIDVALGEVFE
jgi:thiamine-phosphate pyrophosphorylase